MAPLQDKPEADHDQPTADPLGHFLSIPETAKLLTDPAVLDTIVSDRKPLPSGDKQFVRVVLNTRTTMRACVTFLLPSPSAPSSFPRRNGVRTTTLRYPPKSQAMMEGGGPEDGETVEKPFLVFNAILDMGEDLCGFKGTMHGGAVMVVLDEVLCAAATSQTGELYTLVVLLFLVPHLL
jgi:hypothetical protein